MITFLDRRQLVRRFVTATGFSPRPESTLPDMIVTTSIDFNADDSRNGESSKDPVDMGQMVDHYRIGIRIEREKAKDSFAEFYTISDLREVGDPDELRKVLEARVDQFESATVEYCIHLGRVKARRRMCSCQGHHYPRLPFSREP